MDRKSPFEEARLKWASVAGQAAGGSSAAMSSDASTSSTAPKPNLVSVRTSSTQTSAVSSEVPFVPSLLMERVAVAVERIAAFLESGAAGTQPFATSGPGASSAPAESSLVAAGSSALVKVEENNFLKDNESEGEGELVCGICHGPVIESSAVVPCGHYPYCAECLQQVKDTHADFKCPYCMSFVLRALKLTEVLES